MKQSYCRILSIFAYHQTETNGDEIFLKVDGKKVWPTNKRFVELPSGYLSVNSEIPIANPGDVMELKLVEFDPILPNKEIGIFPIETVEIGGPYTTDLKLQGSSYAKYSLTWEIVERRASAV
jgi:hypothetical protein